jgi:hypothetical protein
LARNAAGRLATIKQKWDPENVFRMNLLGRNVAFWAVFGISYLLAISLALVWIKGSTSRLGEVITAPHKADSERIPLLSDEELFEDFLKRVSSPPDLGNRDKGLADLIRKIDAEMVCYFMKADVEEDDQQAGLAPNVDDFDGSDTVAVVAILTNTTNTCGNPGPGRWD